MRSGWLLMVAMVGVLAVGMVQCGMHEVGTVPPQSSAAPVTFAAPLAQADTPAPPAAPVRLVFIHHSTGEAWLDDAHGGLGLALRDAHYFVSDTNYGWGPEGIGDRTDIGNWWEWFRGPNSATYLEALYSESEQHPQFSDPFSRLDEVPAGENEIILFKSCFPNSHVGGNPDDPPTSEDNPLRGQDAYSEHFTVANAKGIYRDLLDYFATRQDRLFVLITSPPLAAGETDATHAANARALTGWLVNEWLASYPYHNVAVFDYFNVLTDSRNHHHWNGSAVEHVVHPDSDNFAAYPTGGGDSHPNAAGDQKATAEFVPLLNVFYHRWKGSSPTPPDPSPTSAAEATPTASPTPEPTPTSATLEPTPTTPPSGLHTLVLQQGVSPDASYQGTSDTTLTLDVNGDQGFADVNLGGAEGLFTHHSSDQHEALLIRWDLSALPADITLQEATLELYRFDGEVNGDMEVALHRLTRGWSEGSGIDFWPGDGYAADGATWNHARPGEPWTAPGGDYDPTVLDQVTIAAAFDDDWIRLDATEGVRAWVEQGQPNEGFLLRALSGEGYHIFYSRNAQDTDASRRPRLVLTYSVGSAETPATPTTVPPTPPDRAVYLPLMVGGQGVAGR